MSKPAETHPFDEPLEILPKGLLAVPLGGLATTLLTLLFAWWVDRTASDFSPMGWYANGIAAHTDWNDITAPGALSSAAHTAYHLGAIRQILAAQGVNEKS